MNAADDLDVHAQAVADRLPPLTDDQRRTIAALLAGAAVSGSTSVAGDRDAA